MTVVLTKAASAASMRAKAHVDVASRFAELRIYLLSVPFTAFILYWFSALVIDAASRQHLFGSDAVLYVWLADPHTFEKLGNFYNIDRITRFHPTTTAMAWAWMNLFRPLTAWMSSEQLLRTMFAGVGAVGVWAAMTAFATFVPRRQVPLWGIIYAVSLGPWFFSSIEESKIVTATLGALYIVGYLRLREHWTARGALALTAILLIACLNEIVAAFLVAIPAVDTLVQRGWDLRCGRWIAAHALVAPAAFAFLEGVVQPHTGGATSEGPVGEAVSHFGMLIFYLSQNDFSAASLYGFLANWLFFSIAAPTQITTFAALPDWPMFHGFFEPSLANYLSSPLSVALALLFGATTAASLLSLWRRERVGGDMAGFFLGLLAYAMARGTFYFILNPRECFLYASGTTLVHLLLFGALFAASKLPFKQALLSAFALLLLIINGAFIIGP